MIYTVVMVTHVNRSVLLNDVQWYSCVSYFMGNLANTNP